MRLHSSPGGMTSILKSGRDQLWQNGLFFPVVTFGTLDFTNSFQGYIEETEQSHITHA